MPYSILLCHIIIVYLTAVPTNSTLLHGERDVTSQRVEIAQGMQVTIACRGGSSRDWKNGSESITTSPFKNVFQSKQSNLANLVIKSMSFAYVGVYTCHVSMDNVPDATVETVTLALRISTQPNTAAMTTTTGKPQPTQVTTQPPPPSKVQGVKVTRSVQRSSPALRVSWSAFSGSGITYTVCYSTTSGTQSDPPSNANCGTSGITGTSTTLRSLSRGTTYYIWVRAVSSGVRGPYSDRRQTITYDGKIMLL
jgi:hypothetical protein